MNPSQLAEQWTAEADRLEAQAKSLVKERMFESANLKRIKAGQLRSCIQDLTACLMPASSN